MIPVTIISMHGFRITMIVCVYFYNQRLSHDQLNCTVFMNMYDVVHE